MTRRQWTNYWNKVDVRSMSDCWHWTAYQDRDGYGTFFFNGAKHLSHRVAYRMAHGRWPEREGSHLCGNPSCVNPLHIADESHAANLARRDRARFSGENGSKARLTAGYVREIRRKAAGGATRRELAAEYGVGYMTISDILRGITWTETRSES